MEVDALLLSRIQFGFTMAFHIIFPAFTIGLASFLARLEAQWLWTGNPMYRNLYRFWVKVFAVSFGLGVVSGIVMSYQLGTNWSRYSDFTGNVLGPLIQYEVITAFFLEAGFLGIMLFGWDRVGDRLHFVSTCMVAIGTLISAFWILSANSWMQTPDGFVVENGRAIATDWWKVIFNPSFPIRYAHMVLGCFLTTAFAVAGMSAWMILRARKEPAEKVAGARLSLSMALWFAVIFTPIQIFVGDTHGLAVLKLQPTKLAAIEANWDRQDNMPLLLFAIPNMQAEKNDFEIGIPRLGSFILTHDFSGVVPGLKDVPRGPASAGLAGLLFVPHHGRDRHGDAGLEPVEPLPALARHALLEPLVPQRGDADDALRVRGGPVRLVHRRDRTPALHRLRAAAHGGRALAPDGQRRDDLADRLPDRLRLHLRVRQLLPRQAPAQRARSRWRRPCAAATWPRSPSVPSPRSTKV